MSITFSRRSFLAAAGAVFLPSLGVSTAAVGLAPLTRVSVAGKDRVAKPTAARPPLAGLSLTPPMDELEFLPVAGIADPTDVVARIRLFGDMHFGYTAPARLAAVAEDLATFPEPDAILSVGDETHFGTATEYARAKDWLARWPKPLFYTVTGNHTFWNHTIRRAESNARLYARFQDSWGLAMPFAVEIGGVRFVGAGPTAGQHSAAGASLLPEQVQELADLLALAPTQPTVVILHSPLYNTVLGDSGPPNSVYTSVDAGFYQLSSDPLRAALQGAPQVVLVINGHTHSPLQAKGLLFPLDTGTTVIPQFNAMALPFVRRDTPHGPRYAQDLITWLLEITKDSLILHGRDHLARQDVARAVVPLTRMAQPRVTVA